jgi:hypothetical protein
MNEETSEASNNSFLEDKNLVKYDDDTHYVAFGDKNMEVFILNMECQVKYNTGESTLNKTYRENLENVFELFKHENLHISYLPIFKFQKKTYGINQDYILTTEEINSALENNKTVVIYIAINNSLDKFRAIVI